MDKYDILSLFVHLSLFLFFALSTCLICVQLGRGITYTSVTEACSKLGGFHVNDRIFECKEKSK